MTLSIRMRDLRVTLALCSTLLLAACLQPYRMEIQQGNIFDQSTLDQVKVGMTKKQVRFLLGTPLVSDPFHANRWDYFYSLDPAKGEKVTQYRLSIWFEDEKIARTLVEGAGLPGAIQPDLEEDSPGFFSNLWDAVTPGD